MKEYLMRFRSQAFEGAISLFKRTLLASFVLNVVVALISALIMVPLVLNALGWSFAEFVNMSENMQEMSERMRSGGDPSTALATMFGTLNITYVLLAILAGLVLYSWIFYMMFNLNDREVRMRDNSFISALTTSFSGSIFSILGFFILYTLIYVAAAAIYVFILALLMQVSNLLGIIIGFIGFFVLIIFMLRFMLALPAIVHGKMPVTGAIAYSMRHLTWKRSGLLFLMAIILMIVFAIFSVITSLIVFSIFKKDGSGTLVIFIANQVVSLITGVIIGTFAYASLSTLYFRYSDDETGDTDYNDHLVE